MGTRHLYWLLTGPSFAVQATYSRTSRYTSQSCTLDFSSLDILYKRILNRNYFERVKNLVEFINIKEARARTIIQYSQQCTVGYGDFHNLMGFTSKQMPNNILKNVR
jgi:hypothetical protein